MGLRQDIQVGLALRRLDSQAGWDRLWAWLLSPGDDAPLPDAEDTTSRPVDSARNAVDGEDLDSQAGEARDEPPQDKG